MLLRLSESSASGVENKKSYELNIMNTFFLPFLRDDSPGGIKTFRVGKKQSGKLGY